MFVLLDLGSEVNAIHLTITKELDLSIRLTDVRMQKIDSIILDIYEMVVAAFLVTDKVNQVKFFEETFLVANVSPEVVLGIPFLILNGADIDFLDWELWWRTYTTKMAFPTTRRIERMGKKKFIVVAFDLKRETFIVHITSLSATSLSSSLLDVHPSCRLQIVGLIIKETSRKVLKKYVDFADVFSPDLASKLPKHTETINYAIELVDDLQPPYGPIYSLEPVKLETLKAFIKTNLANKFIRLSKSPAGAPILFDRKSNGFLQLCVDY